MTALGWLLACSLGAAPEPTPPPRPMGWERKRKVLAEIDRTRRLAA